MRAPLIFAVTAATGLLLASAARPSEPAVADRRPEQLAFASPRDGVQETLLGALPTPPGDAAFGALPTPPGDAMFAALPPPPDKVVLDPGYYGAVTVDHRAHLARRASCVLCHGPGQVHKIGRMTPARAHESCRGCHEKLAKGPTDCRGCHVPKPAPVETTVAEGADAAASPAALAIKAPLPEPGRTAPPDESASDAFAAIRSSVHAGTTVLSAPGVSKPAPGLLVGVTLRGEGFVASQTIEWAGPTVGHGRTIGLLGGGVLLPVNRSSDASLELVGGFDAREASFADMVPALGARAGVEWVGGRRSVRLSVTGLADLSQPHDATARQAGSFTVSGAVTVGLDVLNLR
ncbi:cytochrome c3 family protein [Anaeromyxobacter oryzae]|uniref:Cytochrome c7-like domain-containing protein n=1 Tax=Anaeromyxobacter oryzae TaxID=2918170 RepID=A0ABM7X0K7_9BACT|nr:cytochrome c3 family protein [Anaeromyxobacter oryzae]BDG05267.1 hypothetical protein AMOR_42630 [Anaeromyxobacter oryzae]